MKLIITDTNIFFDIIGIGALPEFFSLDYEICSTEFVIHEILHSDQKQAIDIFIRAKEIKVFSFTSEEIDEILSFNTTKSFKGITDKSVLWKSFKQSCPLLTGDRKLRKETEELGIEVHGSIWVIDTLVKKGLIAREKGIELLNKLKRLNTSLPVKEIDKLIRQYKNKPESKE